MRGLSGPERVAVPRRHGVRRLCAVLVLAGWPGVAAGQMVGAVHHVEVRRGDTVSRIAARHGVSQSHLAAANGRSRTAPLAVGTVLVVDDRHLVPQALAEGIVINVPQRMLFLVEQGMVVAAWPVAAGKAATPTPIGAYQVTSRQVDPTWLVPCSIRDELARAGKPTPDRVPPGPANPLGDRWLGLDRTGVGIHGTNQPGSIYRLGTHGCVRLHPDDMRVLFDRVPVGAPASIVYEPVIVAVVDGRVFVEVHADAYRRLPNPIAFVRQRLRALSVDIGPALDAAVRDVVARRSGRPEALAVQ